MEASETTLIPDPRRPGKHIDPQTGIWPISEWGFECMRGFVSDSRFGPNDLVIKRTNRAITRKWLEAKRGKR